jgi:predicted RNase H-like HicB family nuclease
MKSKLEFTVDIIVEPDGGVFHAYCPALKGLHVDGATEDEAVRNAVEAAEAYLASLIKHKEPIPITTGVLAAGRPKARARTRSERLEVKVA